MMNPECDDTHSIVPNRLSYPFSKMVQDDNGCLKTARDLVSPMRDPAATPWIHHRSETRRMRLLVDATLTLGMSIIQEPI
jgi:hypothetical protein